MKLEKSILPPPKWWLLYLPFPGDWSAGEKFVMLAFTVGAQSSLKASLWSPITLWCYMPPCKRGTLLLLASLQGRSVTVIPCVLELQKFAFAETVTLQSCLCCYSRAGLWLERACPAWRRQMCCHGCLL